MDETKKNFMPAAHPPGWKLNPKYIEPHQTHAASCETNSNLLKLYTTHGGTVPSLEPKSCHFCFHGRG